MKRKSAIVLAMLVGMLAGCLSGCTKEQATRAKKYERNIKTGVKIANEALNVVDALVGVAAPGSTAAKNLDKATVIADKVDDKVQSVTIVIPVDDAP